MAELCANKHSLSNAGLSKNIKIELTAKNKVKPRDPEVLQRTMNWTSKSSFFDPKLNLFEFGEKGGPVKSDIDWTAHNRKVDEISSKLSTQLKLSDYIATNPDMADKYRQDIQEKMQEKQDKVHGIRTQRTEFIKRKFKRNQSEYIQQVRNRSQEFIKVCLFYNSLLATKGLILSI